MTDGISQFMAEGTVLARLTGAHIDDVPMSGIAEALGLGKLVAVGYNGTPTWIDPAATDWADVVAENYGWVQFGFNAYGGDAFSLLAGTGDGSANRILFEAFATGVDAFFTNGDGTIGFQSAASGTSLAITGNIGQTDPILDIGGHFAVAQDGSVGGVAPTTSAPMTWNGTYWVASSTVPPAFASPTVALGTAAATGAAGTVIRSDATIVAFDATSPSTQAIGDAAAVGAATVAARRDHKHAMPAFATNAVALGSSAAAGSAATLIRSDATIAAFDATTPATQAIGDTGTVGTAAFAARRDHKHVMPVAADIYALPASVNTQTGDYTLVLGDAGKIVEANKASAIAITIPPNSSVAFAVGTIITFTQYGAGATTITAGSGVTIRNRLTNVLKGQYSTAQAYQRAANEWVLSGDLT